MNNETGDMYVSKTDDFKPNAKKNSAEKRLCVYQSAVGVQRCSFLEKRKSVNMLFCNWDKVGMMC